MLVYAQNEWDAGATKLPNDKFKFPTLPKQHVMPFNNTEEMLDEDAIAARALSNKLERAAKKKAKEDKKIAELAGERGQGQKER